VGLRSSEKSVGGRYYINLGGWEGGWLPVPPADLRCTYVETTLLLRCCACLISTTHKSLTSLGWNYCAAWGWVELLFKWGHCVGCN